jgi:hypothetical protein
MLCDVISAVTEFMVRVFLLEECYWDSRCCVTSSVRGQSSWLGCFFSRSVIGIHDVV